MDKKNDYIGNLPKTESSFKRRIRYHQGWWRAFVLNEKQGPNPADSSKSVCNTFNINEENKYKNYLSTESKAAVDHELNVQKGTRLISEPRVWNNLLSSQPLSFNFWGYLKYHLNIATQLMKKILPDIDEVKDIKFEWRPVYYKVDHSAFDVLIEYINIQKEVSFIGFECKYTDRLSSKEYDKKEYKEIFNKNRGCFVKPYDFYIQKNYNQLFRNQLMAKDYSGENQCTFKCGLFCSKSDEEALKIANEYQESLANYNEEFVLLTYEHFIEILQRLDIDWEIRVWTMKLWARYIALDLSDNMYMDR